MIIPFAMLALLISIWVSYFISKSIYKSLVKNNNNYPRVFQVLSFLLIFVALSVLFLYFVANSLTFER
jgi:hypothetical protein